MRVLITGIGGFVGSNLAEYLSSMNYEIIGVDKVLNNKIQIKTSEYIVADLTSCDESVINSYKVDYIVHCAGEASVDLYNTHQNTDYLATKKLLQITKNSNIKKLIFLSSNKVDGEDNYSQSKFKMESLIKAELSSFDISYTLIRSSIVYGRGMGSNIYKWLSMIKLGKIPALPRSESRILMISVKDLCRCIEKCISNPATDNKTYVVSDGIPYNINEIELTARQAFSRTEKHLVCPRLLLFLASKLGDLLMNTGIRLPLNFRIYNMLFNNTAHLSNEFEKDTGFKASTNFLSEIPSIFSEI
ncbi:NAD-dependent epimerase/dehydratase family protein [Gammaproteobacteria bacterium]|nr:NAD-dependent epimerase/dehydratase family protein [Gammaproteobacteria bacterium]